MPRRNYVGGGWAGEVATWLLRPPLTGVSTAQWQDLRLIEKPAADSVADRACWRVSLQTDDGVARMWFDDELPILLRFSSGSSASAPPEIFVEVREIRVGSVGPYPIEHDMLREPLHVPLERVPADAGGVLGEIRGAVPELRSLQLCSWDGDGAFVARIVIPTEHGDAELLVDRRSRSAPPYEGTHAAMIRGGDAQWSLSIDHDPEIDRAFARELAKRLPALISGS